MSTWDDMPNDYEHAVRLLETIRNATVRYGLKEAMEIAARHRKDERNETIEECARLVEGGSVPWQMVPSIAELAATIRSLKDKP